MRSAASGESPFSPTISFLTSSHGIYKESKEHLSLQNIRISQSPEHTLEYNIILSEQSLLMICVHLTEIVN